jgi:DUF4097 and DUF4098 domain-containing protein YvlB
VKTMIDSRPYYRRRSLFAPILLVVIGVIILLINIGVIASRSFFWWFSKYWPVVVILWGVVKLAEYLLARSRNETAPEIGPGGVVLLVFFVVIGAICSGLSRATWNLNVDPGQDWNDPFGWFGTRYEFNASFDQPIRSGDQIKIYASRGDITIKPSPDDQAHAFAHKYVRSHNQEEANQFNNNTPLAFQQQGSLWVLNMNSGAYEQGRVDIDLQLPPKYSVSVVDQHGDIHIQQIQSDISVDTAHGDITAEQIKGNAGLRAHHGDVTARGITGNVTVDGDVTDTEVSDVTGTLSFTGSYRGDIDLSHISNQVRFKSIRTDLQLAKLDGELRLDRGDFNGTSVTGPLVLRTDAMNVHVEQITGDVRVEDRRGDVDVQAKAPLGNLDIYTTGGEINVGVPEKPGFQVDAVSDGGEIQSDYSLNINNDRHNATATGTVGDGKTQVKLRTNRGTIEIHKD